MPIPKKYFDENMLLKDINADALSGQQLAQLLESEISKVAHLKSCLLMTLKND